jgi:ABC-type transport system involved in Fe-S cluster assembly fused permease/ATPase subunit
VELLDTHQEIQDRPGARSMDEFRDLIEFQDVCFNYIDQNGETRVLRDININANRDQVIAIVGSSGSGKTTLVGLLPRFYDPTSGCVRIDGTDIREFTQNSLRKQIAMVTQETFLFNDIVRTILPTAISMPLKNKYSGVPAALRIFIINSDEARYADRRGQRLSEASVNGSQLRAPLKCLVILMKPPR